jgi:hypothetical protein
VFQGDEFKKVTDKNMEIIMETVRNHYADPKMVTCSYA